MQVDNPLNLIYHERQLKGSSLCGQHALNALLQGPYFGAEDLGKIARQLDEREQALLIEGGNGLQNLQSSNVDESGNFSIEVLSAALRQHGLFVTRGDKLDATLKSLSSSNEKRYNEDTAPGFLCHLQEHWFTIRYLNGNFWDLNSLYEAPNKLTNFHLMAFMGQLKNEGWSIFFVDGKFPPPIRSKSVGEPENWYEIGKVRAKQQDVDWDDEVELQAALAASLNHQNAGGSQDEDDDLETALQLSLRESSK